MDDIDRIVIVGASLGGASVAAGLREGGFVGEIVVIGEETRRPYERPSLSKAYLSGADTTPTFVHDGDFYAAHGIDLRTGTRAARLDPAARTVLLSDDSSLGFDRLVLATGARPRRLPVAGADLDGVLTLRTVDDSDELRDRAAAAGRVVVVGGGWIGYEVAASLRQLEVDVVLVDRNESALRTVLGAGVGGPFAALHRSHGVDLRLNSRVEALVGQRRVEGVRLVGGEVVPTTLVVAAVGAEARVELARDAGLDLAAGGVHTDARLTTSDPNVLAVGDLAAAPHPVYGRVLRVEHWANARAQGAHAARSLLGDAAEYDRPPYFFSDQFDLGLEYRGWVDPQQPAQLVVRGPMAPDTGWFAFWLRDGRVQAVLNVNEWDDGDALDVLARARPAVDPARLEDPSVPLAELAT